MYRLEKQRESKGYADPRYADSLREFGEPRELPMSGGWILVRQIPGTPFKDAMGCYPLFACRDWAGLRKDMALLAGELVSLTVVTDPFSGTSLEYLADCFDVVRPFKQHYVADLGLPLESFVDRGHRYNVRHALKEMDVEVTREPARYLDAWTALYDHLICRHRISGIGAFSRSCFDAQLHMPGMVMALGRRRGEIVGATLALVQGERAYSHLSAYSPRGYRMRASYGLFWKLLVSLRDEGVRVFDLGGAAGIKDELTNGLARFKAGWSSTRCPVYLCGRILDRDAYNALSARQAPGGDYFPAYRAGEVPARVAEDRSHDGPRGLDMFSR